MVNGTASLNDVRAQIVPIIPARITEILLASITALAKASEVEQACRLAEQACVTLRGTDLTSAR